MMYKPTRKRLCMNKKSDCTKLKAAPQQMEEVKVHIKDKHDQTQRRPE